MIGDNARRCVIEETSPKVNYRRARISLKNLPLVNGETPIENPDLTQTDGWYCLKFQPNKLFKWGPFLIFCDLFDGKKIRVDSYEDMVERSQGDEERAPIFKFLLEWSDISPKHFEIAEEHIMMAVPFMFKIVDYYKMIQKQKHTRKPTLVFRTEDEHEMQKDAFRKIYGKSDEKGQYLKWRNK